MNTHPTRAGCRWAVFGASTSVEHPSDGNGGVSTTAGDNITTSSGTILRALVLFEADATTNEYSLTLYEGDGTTQIGDPVQFPGDTNRYPPYAVDFGPFGINCPNGLSFDAENTALGGLVIFD